MATFSCAACPVACPSCGWSLCFVLAVCVGDRPLGLSLSHLGGALVGPRCHQSCDVWLRAVPLASAAFPTVPSLWKMKENTERSSPWGSVLLQVPRPLVAMSF